MSERLPNGWCFASFERLTENFDGKRVPVKAADRAERQGRYPYYGASGVIDQVDEFLFDGDYLLIAEDGANLLSRSTPIAFPAHGKFWVNNHAHVTKPLFDAPLGYLEAFLNSIDLAPHVTGTAQPKLTQKALNRINVPVPPLNEQRRIVAKLDSLQERSRRARDSLDAVPALLDKLRQSILAAAFRGDLTRDFREKHKDLEPASKLLQRIRTERRKKWEEAELAKLTAKGKPPTDDKWKSKYKEPDPVDPTGLPKLPDGWCWAASEEVVEPDADIVYGIVQPGKVDPAGVPYVRGMDIQDGVILEAQLQRTAPEIAKKYERAALRGGDVLLGIIRATKVAVVPASLEGANITQGTARFRPGSCITTDYLAGWLDTPFAQGWLHAHYRGIDMPGLNLQDVRRLPVALAPFAEQNAVIQSLSAQLARVRVTRDAYERTMVQHASLDNSILAKAFRGELVPQDPSDEPADVMLARTTASPAPAREKRGRRPGAKESHPE